MKTIICSFSIFIFFLSPTSCSVDEYGVLTNTEDVSTSSDCSTPQEPDAIDPIKPPTKP